MDPDEAEYLVNRLRRDFRLQGDELKGRNLLMRPTGHKVVSELLKQLDGRFTLAVHRKAFALCCKFFEYIFEPTVSDSNSFFYQIDFHLYIGTVLYRFLQMKRANAEQLLQALSIYVRKGKTETFHEILPRVAPSSAISLEDPLLMIGIFASIHRNTISDEIGRVDDGEPRWFLDLTHTALHHQPTRWSKKIRISFCYL